MSRMVNNTCTFKKMATRFCELGEPLLITSGYYKRTYMYINFNGALHNLLTINDNVKISDLPQMYASCMVGFVALGMWV